MTRPAPAPPSVARDLAWMLPLAGLLACVAPSTTPPPVAPAPAAAAPVAVAPTPTRAVEPTPPPEPVEPAAAPPWTDADLPRIRALQPKIRAAAQRHGVDPHVMNAIIWHESHFNASARGPGGAAGLMQLMPTTSKSLAKRLHRANRPFDPDFNLDAGAYLLSRLLTIFDGDLDLALAGYALGHVAVRRRLEAGEPLPDRTQRFIAKVHAWSAAFARLDELALAACRSAPSGT